MLGIVAALVAVAGVTTGCGGRTSEATADEDRPTVVAAFYPLAFAAEAVGGDLVQVENLTPSGVEPHDLELSAGEVRSLSEADLIVFLGKGFQPAVEDVVSSLNGPRILDVLKEKHLLQSVGGEEHEGEDEHDESTIDPHVWLDPSIMGAIVDEVAALLVEINPDHRETYEANAAELNSRLIALDKHFSEGLSSCASRDIVTSHAAFGYLAARYDLNQVSISGIDPEAEPSPGRFAEVARFVQEHDVSTIFFEELVSPEVAETIAAETGARTAMLSPLESEPESGNYVDAMEANLAALTEALDCG
jgi:zinc transport system substrate-binding protein